jgi:hypothetical protein
MVSVKGLHNCRSALEEVIDFSAKESSQTHVATGCHDILVRTIMLSEKVKFQTFNEVIAYTFWQRTSSNAVVIPTCLEYLELKSWPAVATSI